MPAFVSFQCRNRVALNQTSPPSVGRAAAAGRQPRAGAAGRQPRAGAAGLQPQARPAAAGPRCAGQTAGRKLPRRRPRSQPRQLDRTGHGRPQGVASAAQLGLHLLPPANPARGRRRRRGLGRQSFLSLPHSISGRHVPSRTFRRMHGQSTRWHARRAAVPAHRCALCARAAVTRARCRAFCARATPLQRTRARRRA